VWHPYGTLPAALPSLPVASAKGVRLRLADGRQLIDGMASWWCAIHGYRHPVLDEAVRKQLGQMAHVMFGGLTHEPAVRLVSRLVQMAPDGLEREYPWGNQAPLPENGNFDFQCWDPMPVNAFNGNRSAFGVEQMVGNGWEWTSTVFAPFPGFQPFAFYPGYSASFFDGNHYVMKGGSARTAACMLRRSFRNWFQPHYQYVYAGFRCASQ